MNRSADARASSPRIRLRLDGDLLDKIDGLAKAEGVERTDLMRRMLADALAHRRIDVAIGDYAAGRRTAWSASELAGVDLYEMLDRIVEAGIPYRIDPEVIRPGL